MQIEKTVGYYFLNYFKITKDLKTLGGSKKWGLS